MTAAIGAMSATPVMPQTSVGYNSNLAVANSVQVNNDVASPSSIVSIGGNNGSMFVGLTGTNAYSAVQDMGSSSSSSSNTSDQMMQMIILMLMMQLLQ